MSDDKTNTGNKAGSGDKSSAGIGTPGGKRPVAMLDLKATEIKLTPISEKSAVSAAASSRAGGITGSSASASSPSDALPASVPGPAPASSYATDASGAGKTAAKAPFASGSKTAAERAQSTSARAAASSSASPIGTETTKMQMRGGFFGHIAAGVIGGVLALAASEWVLPQIGGHGTTSRLADDTAAIAQRLQALEKSGPSSDGSKSLASLETRLSALESTAQTIPALTESQSRLVAETKATLAAAASDGGAPELISRLANLEDRLKALADAGANDPNAGRLPQLAALTGKVADLETSLATQLTALRKSVTDDVESRLVSAREASEAAKSGTQRIDRDVAAVKGDSLRIEEQLQALKTDGVAIAGKLKSAQEETASLKSALDTLQIAAAKPADVAAAVAPVAQKIANLEQNVQTVMKSENDNRTNGERVVLAIQLQNLKRALDRGQKYDAELAEVQKIAGDKLDLSPLAKLKDTGVPAAADLVKEFRTTANAAIDAETEPAEGSVVDRLWAGAKSVVRVRKIDHKPDDKSTEAIVGRMEVALNEARLTDVLEEGKTLPQKAQDTARPFLDKVAARVSVDGAITALEAQMKSSFAAGGGDNSAAETATEAPKTAP